MRGGQDRVAFAARLLDRFVGYLLCLQERLAENPLRSRQRLVVGGHRGEFGTRSVELFGEALNLTLEAGDVPVDLVSVVHASRAACTERKGRL